MHTKSIHGIFPYGSQFASMVRRMRAAVLVTGISFIVFSALGQEVKSASPDTSDQDSAQAKTPKPEECEAMDIGGLVTLDYGAPINNFKNQALQIGRIELRAVVNVNQNVKGFITLLSEGDLHKIRIYQAAADLTLQKPSLEFIAGQQIFNHGLMTTRLINYPLGYGLVLPNQPGVTGVYTLGNAKVSLAGLMVENASEPKPQSILSTRGDTVWLPGATADTSRFLGCVAGADYSFANGSNTHVSMLVSHDKIDLDVACALIVRNLTLDGEIYSQLKMSENGAKAATYCAGASYALSDAFSLAFRNDGLSEDRFKDFTMLYAGGCVYKIFGDCYIAFEYDYQKPSMGEAINSIALEFGLQSTLKLPGFQRKSLTQE